MTSGEKPVRVHHELHMTCPDGNVVSIEFATEEEAHACLCRCLRWGQTQQATKTKNCKQMSYLTIFNSPLSDYSAKRAEILTRQLLLEIDLLNNATLETRLDTLRKLRSEIAILTSNPRRRP